MKNPSTNQGPQNYNRSEETYNTAPSQAQRWRSPQHLTQQWHEGNYRQQSDRSLGNYDGESGLRNTQYGIGANGESWDDATARYQGASERFENQSSYGTQASGTFGSQGGYDNRPQGYGYNVTQQNEQFNSQSPPYGQTRSNSGYVRHGAGTDRNQDTYQGHREQYGPQSGYGKQPHAVPYDHVINRELYGADGNWDHQMRMNSRSLPQDPFDQRMGFTTSQGAQSFRAPKGYARTDERVREDVCDCLGRLRNVDPSDIEVAVKGGEVTLTGTVDMRSSKHQVENAIEGVSGVQEIHNQLRVSKNTSDSVGSTANMRERSRGFENDSASSTQKNRFEVNNGTASTTSAKAPSISVKQS